MNPDGLVWYIDPFAAVLLALYVLGVAVLLSFDTLVIVKRKCRSDGDKEA